MTDEQTRAPIELRTATLQAVDYPARTIELIAVPYDEWAPVDYAGRIVAESFAPGAFAGVERRVGRARFQVNLEHDPDQWVGRIDTLDTRAPAGLRAVLRIRSTPEGDQALTDAAEGFYGASVGFAPIAGGEQWETRDRRRIVKAYLDHIALTRQPAYEGAGVIAVRTAPAATSATPNLDRILAERGARAYAAGEIERGHPVGEGTAETGRPGSGPRS